MSSNTDITKDLGQKSWNSPVDDDALADVASGLIPSYPGVVGLNESSNKPMCRFFLINSCKAGDNCQFSHSLETVNIASQICEICCENVVSKGSKFGLMDNCDHVFCLDCIRSWRNQKLSQERLNLRKCPICRLDSFIVIPSTRHLRGQDKLDEKVRYTRHLSQMPCKNFASGKCTFGSSCMYYHPLAEISSDFKMITGADGKKTKNSGIQLSHFIK